MADRLHLGTTLGGKRFRVPVEVITQTIAVLGIRGSGKTNTATVMTEELLSRGHHVVIIDPLDVWWGLRSLADGKRAGHPVVVLGGPHGDLPLQETDGEVLADFAVEERVPLVLSLRHLRKAAQRRFVTEFAERLYHRKGEVQHRVPLLLVIDESDAFVPQRVGGSEARMVGAIEDLVRRGRAAGIGVTLISQRAASINKDVLTQLELLVAHRHTSPQDRKALQEWIRAHDTEGREAEFMGDLAALPVGTAWVWSPGWMDVFERVRIRERETFDSSKTPKVGERAAAPARLADVDLVALRGRLAKTVEEARANDPKELKRRIAELEAEVRRAAKAPAPPDNAVIERAVEAAAAPLRDQVRHLFVRIHAATALVEQLGKVLRNGDGPSAWNDSENIPTRFPTPASATAVAVTRSRAAAAESGSANRVEKSEPRRAPAAAGDLPKGEAAILTAACQYPDGVDRQQLSILTGYKRSSRDTYVQRLQARGLVEVRGALVVAAAGAERHLGDFEPLPTGAALQDYWLARLPAGEAAILEVLLAHPEGVTREVISDLTAYRRSSRDTYIRRLRARKIVEVDGSTVRAADLLK